MKNIIDKWKQYILKNHPILWMSGFHIILPVLIPIFILGYIWGINLDLTTRVSFLIQMAAILSITLLIVIITFQVLRFSKDVSYPQLVKYYFFCAIIYSLTIISSFNFTKGFENKLSTSSQEDIQKQLKYFQSYIWAKALLPIYNNNKCNYEIWLKNNPGLNFYSGELSFINSSAICASSDKSLNSMIAEINMAIFELDLYSQYEYGRGRYGLIGDNEDSYDAYKFRIMEANAGHDSVYPINSETTIEQRIERLKKNPYHYRAYRGYIHIPVENRMATLDFAANLIVDNSLDTYYELFIEPSNVWPLDLKEEAKTFLSKKNEVDNQYALASKDFHEFYNDLNLATGVNYRGSILSNRKMIYLFYLLLLVVCCVFGTLIITSRFKIAAVLSPFIGAVPWFIGYLILTELFELYSGDDKIFSLLAFGAAVFVFFYWIRNHRIKSITLLKSMLLHITNMSFIAVLFLIFALYDSGSNRETLFIAAIVLSSIALLANLFFLYQYHRHLRLPVKSK